MTPEETEPSPRQFPHEIAEFGFDPAHVEDDRVRTELSAPCGKEFPNPARGQGEHGKVRLAEGVRNAVNRAVRESVPEHVPVPIESEHLKPLFSAPAVRRLQSLCETPADEPEPRDEHPRRHSFLPSSAA